jgi:hypothetical protein
LPSVPSPCTVVGSGAPGASSCTWLESGASADGLPVTHYCANSNLVDTFLEGDARANVGELKGVFAADFAAELVLGERSNSALFGDVAVGAENANAMLVCPALRASRASWADVSCTGSGDENAEVVVASTTNLWVSRRAAKRSRAAAAAAVTQQMARLNTKGKGKGKGRGKGCAPPLPLPPESSSRLSKAARRAKAESCAAPAVSKGKGKGMNGRPRGSFVGLFAAEAGVVEVATPSTASVGAEDDSGALAQLAIIVALSVDELSERFKIDRDLAARLLSATKTLMPAAVPAVPG